MIAPRQCRVNTSRLGAAWGWALRGKAVARARSALAERRLPLRGGARGLWGPLFKKIVRPPFSCVCACPAPVTPLLAMASDRSLSSVSPSSRAPPESPCLAMAGAGSSTTIQRLLPIRSARPRERFSDLLTMIDGKSMATLICPAGVPGARELAFGLSSPRY